MKTHNHPFHMVTPSPWPTLTSISLMSTMMNMVLMMKAMPNSTPLATLSTLLCIAQWWRDVIRESFLQGLHTKKVVRGIKMGMILFIGSEALLFISLFWMLLHSSLAPTPEIAMKWPPPNIKPFNPFDIPLLNSTLLITSGMFLTWSHYCMVSNKLNINPTPPLTTAIYLGMIFTAIQAYEYKSSPFTISDSIYGSAFFLMTGFHGAHVLVGITFLSVTATRVKMQQMSSKHHLNFEMSAWYWHFVDVVWIILYLMLYI